ncbi:MAG: hypothetical protein ACFFCP_17660 [Promethearchaeota archaeon]
MLNVLLETLRTRAMDFELRVGIGAIEVIEVSEHGISCQNLHVVDMKYGKKSVI